MLLSKKSLILCAPLFSASTQAAPPLQKEQLRSFITSHKKAIGTITMGLSLAAATTLLKNPKMSPFSDSSWGSYMPSHNSLALIPISCLFSLGSWLHTREDRALPKTPSIFERILPSSEKLGDISMSLSTMLMGWWTWNCGSDNFVSGNTPNLLSQKRSEGLYSNGRGIPKDTFSNIAGGIPHDIETIVDIIRNADRYKHMGASMPKGYLLAGPPGTGKTALARALAGEVGIPFIAHAASNFVEIFVGSGAKNVRELFREARALAAREDGKKAIIFIDEIDAIGCKRNSGTGDHQMYRETINALLEEMDGFKDSSDIFVLAATNIPQDLDPALTRPGRFDKTVRIDLPNPKQRLAILRHYWDKLPFKARLENDHMLAELLKKWTGAHIKTAVNQAAIRAVRENAQIVTVKHLLEACAEMAEEQK